MAVGEVSAGMRTSGRADPFAFLLKQDDERNVHPIVVLTTARDDNMMVEPERRLAHSIVYLCALLANRPRPIDRYIDYFGETHNVPETLAWRPRKP